MKDEILQTEELAAELIQFLNRCYPGALEGKYGTEPSRDPYGRTLQMRQRPSLPPA